ncbi:hypothetical protein DPEC_G00216690 [Dallia pectoralis]|uniref:Uncharacterized protein n=1 Tax=Dallia pectoralis TaxID=75939 RepID=A0ACC2G2Q4_DALPE|nr:hypothetical protein DPEC_G00216690 [Dallia pectoralis]
MRFTSTVSIFLSSSCLLGRCPDLCNMGCGNSSSASTSGGGPAETGKDLNSHSPVKATVFLYFPVNNKGNELYITRQKNPRQTMRNEGTMVACTLVSPLTWTRLPPASPRPQAKIWEGTSSMQLRAAVELFTTHRDIQFRAGESRCR